MARKPLKRRSIRLFDAPDRSDENDDVGVFGAPAADSGVLGGAGQSSGLFDAPDRSPGEMPGLFQRPSRPAADGAGRADKPARPAPRGLFDKPPPRQK